MSHHAASSRANQSQSLEVTDNADEPIGDRWDDEEDWGSLEVRFHCFSLNMKIANYYVGRSEYVRLCCVIMIAICFSASKEPEKAQTETDDWNTDWSGMASSKKKVSDRGV